jgi:hypothetical protein
MLVFSNPNTMEGKCVLKQQVTDIKHLYCTDYDLRLIFSNAGWGFMRKCHIENEKRAEMQHNILRSRRQQNAAFLAERATKKNITLGSYHSLW